MAPPASTGSSSSGGGVGGTMTNLLAPRMRQVLLALLLVGAGFWLHSAASAFLASVSSSSLHSHSLHDAPIRISSDRRNALGESGGGEGAGAGVASNLWGNKGVGGGAEAGVRKGEVEGHGSEGNEEEGVGEGMAGTGSGADKSSSAGSSATGWLGLPRAGQQREQQQQQEQKPKQASLTKDKAMLRKILLEAERLYKRNVRRRTRSFGVGGKRLRKLQVPKTLTAQQKAMWHPSAYVLEYYRPLYQCLLEERFSMWSDVGRWVCRPDLVGPDSVIYSFFVGSAGAVGVAASSDAALQQWEVEMYRRTQAEIYLYGTRVRRKHERSMGKREEFRYRQRGLGAVNNNTAGESTLKALMAENGHSFLDILRLNCDGCELNVFDNIFADGVKIGQIMVDVHHVMEKRRLQHMFQVLESNGFRAFRMEQDWRHMDVLVYAFIHESLCDPLSVKLDDDDSDDDDVR